MTICRRLRQHKFSPPFCRGLTPVGLKPSLHEVPATIQNEPNRQRIHLAEPKRCLDEAGHLLEQWEGFETSASSLAAVALSQG